MEELTNKQEDFVLDQQKESLRLTRNSRGYNWAIKLMEEKIDDAMIERLKVIEDKLNKEYGKEDE